MTPPSSSAFSEAAREYRASRPKSDGRAKSSGFSNEIEQEARRAFVFDELFEAIRYATGALVAIGAGDYDLAQSAMANFVAATRLAVRTWDAHETARSTEASKPEGRAA
jgi:hypothetical protein